MYAHQGSLWELNGNNTYTGQTSIYDSGTRLRAGSTTAIGDLSPVVMGSAGILELDGFSNTIGSLQSATRSVSMVRPPPVSSRPWAATSRFRTRSTTSSRPTR